MKKLLMAVIVSLFCIYSSGQEKIYLVFEFMKVANHQEMDYWQTEDFWAKIHTERVKNGDILDWDLWALKPGGMEQGYQYLTVTVFDDAVKALEGGDVWAAARKAYPTLTDEELSKKLTHGAKSRMLCKRMFLAIINSTKDEFKIDVGTVAKLNFMEVLDGKYLDYEKAEDELFKPMHQKRVDEGKLAHWGVAKVLLPAGEKVKTTHLTYDMFKDYKHFVDSHDDGDAEKPDEETIKKMKNALQTRSLNWMYIGQLVKSVEQD